MRKATKTIISLAVVLIAGLNFIVPAFAQDPFTSIAIGGITGASGAGLFGSMAGMSGINIGWDADGSDPMDAMWNVLNPDHVYFSGEKHEADPQTDPEDVWDYITVDLGDWLDAQSDFIINFAQANNVQDNDSGSMTTERSFLGLPLDSSNSCVLGYVSGTGVYNFGPFNLTITSDRPDGYLCSARCSNGTSAGTSTRWYINEISAFPWRVRVNLNNNRWSIDVYRPQYNVWGLWCGGNSGQTGTITPSKNIPWTSSEVNTNVFDGWENAKVKIPHNISGLQPGWTIPDFTNALNDLWSQGQQGQIVIEDTDQPVPPPPIPDTPLGDVPFDDWVDLWGQSIWEQLTRLEEKQELMVINQDAGLDSLDDLQGLGEDLIEDVDDLIGLETDINENLEDVITYEQGISEDVEDIGEYVEDIDDEVIVIVDEMGNVIDVLDGIDAKIYAQGQTIGSISTEVGTVADASEAIQTEVEAQTETQEDIKDAVEDMVPYVAPLPDIATDTETIVDILPDIATATETSTETLTDTLPDIKDATQTMTDTLPDIITEIQDATTTLTDEIPNIDDICLNIDEAPYKDLETGVDRLPRFLLPFITDLRSALGIWHYVTEWLAQISTTFAFITGCLVGTSMMTPIYAAIAGFMCIKIYKRMCS